MRDRGLTLRGLCRAADLDPSFFSKVLAGKRSPPAQEPALRRIAQVLDLDPAELIVSAGRIPLEWRALWEDPELFREVHARATGGAAAPRPAVPAARRVSAPSPVPAQVPVPVRRGPVPGQLSEELL